MTKLVFFAVVTATGFLANTATASRENSWSPSIAMLLLIAAPFPMLIFCSEPNEGMPDSLRDEEDDTRGNAHDVGAFLFGALVTAAFGTLFIAFHNYYLSVAGFLWAIFSACAMGTVSFVVAKCAVRGTLF